MLLRGGMARGTIRPIRVCDLRHILSKPRLVRLAQQLLFSAALYGACVPHVSYAGARVRAGVPVSSMVHASSAHVRACVYGYAKPASTLALAMPSVCAMAPPLTTTALLGVYAPAQPWICRGGVYLPLWVRQSYPLTHVRSERHEEGRLAQCTGESI